ncbi:DUF1097 domain-containing protein [Caulobacter radicis]|uniref:DUF1097 domain-containing protein n=1 Tax=Caulobacter radicis TaxID=2172650 RepID=UPI000D5673BF|nr:DUF1097 domain-containing protein [Caulobacter radicis]PVM85562.1 DUF1097 domain-containing protein [Caulobacter radicis]
MPALPALSAFATPKSAQFHAVSLSVAAVAGIATLGVTSVMLPPPAMFLGWAAFNLAGDDLRGGLANTVSHLLGLALGAGTALLIGAMTPALGLLATPLAVIGVVIVVLSLREIAPINNPLAYFLGLTSFFYSGLAPSASTLAMLGSAAVIGGAACAVAAFAQDAVARAGEVRHA